MPKLKTNKGAAKRFKMTKNGKVKCAKSGARHLMSSKSPKRKRKLRGTTILSEAEEKRIALLLPYGSR